MFSLFNNDDSDEQNVKKEEDKNKGITKKSSEPHKGESNEEAKVDKLKDSVI